jgi:hypothetical protein
MPWAGLGPYEVVRRVTAGETLEPHLPRDVRPDLRQLLVDCWRMEPRQRPTMRAVHDTLLEIRARVMALEDDSIDAYGGVRSSSVLSSRSGTQLASGSAARVLSGSGLLRAVGGRGATVAADDGDGSRGIVDPAARRYRVAIGAVTALAAVAALVLAWRAGSEGGTSAAAVAPLHAPRRAAGGAVTVVGGGGSVLQGVTVPTDAAVPAGSSSSSARAAPRPRDTVGMLCLRLWNKMFPPPF